MHSAKTLKCSFCSETFKCKSVLEIHTLYHLNQKKQIKGQLFKKLFICNENSGIQISDEGILNCHSGFSQNLVSPNVEAADDENFKCHFCIKTFSSYRRLRWHLRCHNSGKPFKCHLCSSAFRYIGSLKTHLDVHANGKPHKCRLCTESFSFRKELYEHTLTHFDEDKLHRCHICGKAFRQRGTLKAHMVTHATNPFKCNVCSKTFNHSGSLRRHMASHSDEKLFKCHMCPRSYRMQNSLKVHIISHYKHGLLKYKDTYRCNIDSKKNMYHEPLSECAVADGNFNKFRCKLCAEKFCSRSDLKLHMILHLDGDQLKCLICFKTYNRRFSFKRHMSQHFLESSSNADQKEIDFSYQENKSSGFKNLEYQNKAGMSNQSRRCSVCARKFHSEVDFAGHLCTSSVEMGMDYTSDRAGTSVVSQNHMYMGMPKQDASVPFEKPFQCDVCFKKFTAEGSLKRHEKVHSSEKQFKCHLCLRLFTFYHDLRKHMARHMDGKSYTCSVCAEKFDMREDLQDHILTHSDEKGLFKCHECKKVYLSRYSLMIHMQSHSSERLYKCGLCEKSFKHSQNLQQHVSDEHSTWEPFRCRLCPKVFRKMNSLKQHSASHSLGKSYSCLICDMTFEIPEELESHVIIHNTGLEDFVNIDTEEISDSDTDMHIGSPSFEEDEAYHDEDGSLVDKREAMESSAKRGRKASIMSASKYSLGQSVSKLSWKCDLCSERFQSRGLLKMHMIFHSNEKPYQCHLCFKFFRHYSNLSRHLPKHLEGKPEKYSSTGKHIAEHSVKDLHKCSVCPETFSSKTALCGHFLMHNDEKLFRCHICTRSFINRNRLRSHLRIHSDGKLFHCEVCKMYFKSSQSLNKHLADEHSGEKPVKCRFFTKTVKAKSKTKQSSNRPQSGMRDKNVLKNVVCKFCTKEFTKLYNLKWHMTEHLYEAAMEAANSERRSMDVDHHVEDENMVHLVFSAYNCHICNTNCEDENDLVRHLSTHSSKMSADDSGRMISIINDSAVPEKEIQYETNFDFKPYKCSKCLKEFKTELECIEHKGLHEERSFRCHICMKTFKWKESLSLHLSTHLQEKPFKCHLCAKSFIFRLNLRQHMYQHLEKELFQYQRYTSKDDYNQVNSAKVADASARQAREQKQESEVLPPKLQEEQQLCEGKLSGTGPHVDSIYLKNDSTEVRKPDLSEQVMIHFSGTAVESINEPNFLKAECHTHRSEDVNMPPSKQVIESVRKGETGISSFSDKAECFVPADSCVGNPIASTDYSRNKAQAGESSLCFKSSEVLNKTESNISQASNHEITRPLQMTTRRQGHPDQPKREITCFKQENEDICDSGPSPPVRKLRMQSTKDEDIFECHLCPKSFRIKWQLKYHLISHSNERPFKCHLCPKSFKYSSAYKRHVWQYTHDKRTSKRRYECHICKRSFIEKTHLKLHLITHSEKKAFQCDICDKSYKHRFSLRRHKFEEHDDREPFRCRICSKVLKNRRNLNNHIALHSQESLQKYKSAELDCDNIQPDYAESHKTHENYMSSHNEYSVDSDIDERNENSICDQTENLGRYESDDCQINQLNTCSVERQESISSNHTEFMAKDSLWIKEFENLEDLIEKIDSSGDDIWRCKMCDRTAKTKANLKWHMLTHSDRRHFKCMFCPKKYKYSSTLNRHMDLKHPQKRDFAVAVRPEEARVRIVSSQRAELGSQNGRLIDKPSHKCVVCKLEFEVEDDHMEHLATHFHV